MLVIFYNGFDKPEEIDMDSVMVESNYLGDITQELKEEWEYVLENYTLEDMIENQPLQQSFSIWIEPTLQQLIDFNRSVMLDDMDYIGGFELK